MLNTKFQYKLINVKDHLDIFLLLNSSLSPLHPCCYFIRFVHTCSVQLPLASTLHPPPFCCFVMFVQTCSVCRCASCSCCSLKCDELLLCCKTSSTRSLRSRQLVVLMARRSRKAFKSFTLNFTFKSLRVKLPILNTKCYRLKVLESYFSFYF